ncbi:hypothetical protein KM043_005970 [Ampulex compressa]|nr:hypothetical protein KM043_005970 [Ampulex compressa]
MIDTERDFAPKQSSSDPNVLLEEYSAIVEDLKRELYRCKVEQNSLRGEVEVLRSESKNVCNVQETFSRIHLEECGSKNTNEKELANLQERIVLLQMEKDSALQLWHVSLKAIDVLEEELRNYRKDGKGSKFYEEQVNVVKETYSDAIKALEEKLLQAKENFLKQQSLWENSKSKIEALAKEKNNVVQKFAMLQSEAENKDRTSQQTIENLKKELGHTKTEAKKMQQLKVELEKRLVETKLFADNVVQKDNETKAKMAEAIELIESVVREKDLILQREAHVLEEKARLEHRLAAIVDEYAIKMQEQNIKVRNEHEHDMQKYLSEIKELKSQLREKATLVDRAQRECKLMEEELERVRQDSENVLHKTNAKVLEYEQKLKRAELQTQMCSDVTVNKYDTEIKQLEQKVINLEDKLVSANSKLRDLHEQNTSDAINWVAHPDPKTKIIYQQYSNLESMLAKSLDDKESVVVELKSLKLAFDHEIQKRDNEKYLLENKISQLETNLQKTKYATEEKLHNVTIQELNSHNPMRKHGSDVESINKSHCCQFVLSEQLNKLQETFDKKTKELSQHVEVHQKLSKKWSDEAKSLTERFQAKTKELRSKINILRKENNELNKELLVCRQQLIGYDQGSGFR